MGQKNGQTRLWAKTGTRPHRSADQCYGSAYLLGAICPKQGKGAGLVLPRCNTEAMTLHLAKISSTVGQRAQGCSADIRALEPCPFLVGDVEFLDAVE